jgi:photosystem II stability/assembly factor-like uncharacterized protein
MKKILLSIVLIAALPIGWIVKDHLYKDLENENAEREGPYEYFNFMRSYPDPTMDMDAYNKMLKDAESNAKMKQSNSVLSWTNEGPNNIGGRITALEIHPTNTNVIFAGCPGGGLFRSTDAGVTWNPIFDSQAFLSIACIAFDPVNPNIMYVGTGDPDTPFTVLVGNGIYKSTDGGNTWTNLGLGQMGIISKILIDPGNSNIIYAAAMGTPMVRDLNRGIYKSTNGGTNWNQILSINNETGISDMVMDFTNSAVIYATSWTRIRTNQESTGYSNTTRVYKTINSGTNWNMINNGLPNTKLSRYAICMSNQNAQKIYVAACDSLYQLEGMYVSTNGGALFTPLAGWNQIASNYNGFGWYFGRLTVKPNDDDDILISGVEHWRSTDGGNNFFMNQPQWWNYNPHSDIHNIRFRTPSNYILATDGGLYETYDDGASWNKLDNIPNTQYYKVNYNPFLSTEYCGGAQDNGTMYGGAISGINNWLREWGGDGFQPLLDATNNQNRYAECQNGALYVSTDGGNSYNDFNNGIDPNDRCNWDMPYCFGGNNQTVMFTGTYRMYKNIGNPVANWNAISPDLTDGIIFEPRFHNISCVSNSKLNTQYIYAGTSDANAWRSLNGGTTWTNVTTGLPNRYVTSIKASPTVTNNVYVSHSGYRANDYIPHIHKSTNNGTTWTDISGNLPQAAINDIQLVPGFENVIFVATDIGVYYTQNGGTNWALLGNNLPIMVIWDLELNPTTNKLIAGTFARGMFTMDISSLKVLVSVDEPEKESSDLILYPNPCSGQFFVKTASSEGKMSYKIYNYEGKMVQEGEINSDPSVNVSRLSKGIYNVVLEKDGKSSLTKLIHL